ncbi:Membrane protein involved in the export of O-antigen and teichoic acid [Halopseudomonas xinjiangensis]|uniref:Membrane protein involved in the export of O-antigen and teichoic acid n=1 Tax=Halopseudomonas xinjiangensis TaxID=487184 RepID=A0A1H1R3E9_9GAMM|nr:flippase [Halopseudomonas xinjiangensis]SDS30150.1 Membrane protein involved in the export of O-antigen and teichoic acid [Halopseudomonas xinjiangensis]
MGSGKTSELRKYLFNSGWLLLDKILMLGAGLAASLIVARFLGPEDFGYLNYALALVALLQIVCHLGMTGLLVKELRVRPEEEDRILSSVFVLKVGAAVLAYGLMLLIWFADDDHRMAVLPLVGIMLIFTPFEMLNDWFQSRVKAKYAAVAGMVGQIGGSSLKIIAAVAGFGLVAVAAAHVSIIVITVVLLSFFAFRLKRGFRFDFSWSLSKELLGKSFLIFLGSLSAVIYLKVDQIMLQHLVGDSAVGQYAAAAKLSEAWYILPQVLMASIFPKIIDISHGDKSKFNDFLQVTFDLLFLAALGLSLFVFLFSDLIIAVLYGEAYSEAAMVLSIHIFASVFVFMRALFSKWIILEEVFIFSLITQGLGAFSNVLLNYWLIQSHGAVGAAIATLVSYSIASYFSLLLSKKTRGIFWMMTRSIFLHAFLSVPAQIRNFRRS